MQPIEVKYGPRFMQPGIFFKFQMSPYEVVTMEVETPLLHLIASCLSIIGGAFLALEFIAGAYGKFFDLFLCGLFQRRDNDLYPPLVDDSKQTISEEQEIKNQIERGLTNVIPD